VSTDATAELQRRIDEGGDVRVEAGTYVVRTLHLRSGVTLELTRGATLVAHRNNGAFDLQEKLPCDPHSDMETSDFAHALLAGRDLDGVRIVGEGTIDMERTFRWGPKPIALRECREVEVSGITIRRAPNYSVSLGACDDVLVARVTIRDALSDGIDPDSCRRVRIVDCDVEADDDAICVKSSCFLGSPRASEDIEVSGCRTRSGTNGFKIGTETSGDVRRVRVHGCDFDARPREGRDPRMADLHDLHEAGGISLQSVDGANVEDVVIERVNITHARGALSLRLGARGRGQELVRAGSLRDIVVRDVEIADAREPSSIVGLRDAPIERVAFERVRFGMTGGGRRDDRAVPELADAYPQNTMFGVLPAAVLYARRVDTLALRDVTFELREADARPPFVFDDVTGLTES